MSDKEEEKQKPAEAPMEPAELLKLLERKISLYKILLIAGFSLFVVILCVVIPAYATIYVKVSALEHTLSTEEVEARLKDIKKEVAALREFREGEVKSIEQVIIEIDGLREVRRSFSMEVVKEVLLSREADYQRMTGVLVQGIDNLSGMVPGQRDWVKTYEQEMEALKQRSAERAQLISMSLKDDNPESGENE